MTMSQGKRREGHGKGTVGKMRAYFSDPANSGEYLTYQDVVTKFGFSNIDVAKQAVYSLKNEGLVRSERVVFADPERPR